MEVDLKQFTMTLAVGLALALLLTSACLILLSSRPSFISSLKDIRPTKFIAPAVIAAVPLLALGLLIEDLSKRALEPPASQPHSSLAERFREIMPSEKFIRVNALVKAHASDVDKFRRCLDESASEPVDSSENILVKARDIGRRLSRTLDELNANASATEETHRETLKKITNTRSEFATLDCRALREDAALIYYMAKNRVYLHTRVHDELEEIRDRYVFQRSLAFAILCGTHFLVVAYIFKSAIDLWKDVGKTETAIAVILMTIAIASIIDTLFGPLWLREIRNSEEWARLILPAVFAWLCVFRLRRVPRRLPKFIKSAWSSFGSERLIISTREKCTAQAISFVAISVCLLSVISMAYHEDQDNYVKRVYGYFDTIKGMQVTKEGGQQ